MGPAWRELGGTEAVRSGGCGKTSGQEKGRVEVARLESGTPECPFAGAALGTAGDTKRSLGWVTNGTRD